MAIIDQFPSGGGGDKIDLSGATVTLDNNELKYDGRAKTKTVTSVVLDGTTLTANTDYVVAGNIEQNIGIYVLRVIGIGDYIGTAVAEWEIITPRDMPVTPLSANTPDQIKYAAELGIASTLWSVGDVTAPITISSTSALPNFTPGTAICAFILGFDHNSTREGMGISFQLGKTTGGVNVAYADSGCGSVAQSGIWFNMNNSNTNPGGWESSRMRTTIIPAFISAMPSEWQEVLADTTKYSDNTGGTSGLSSCITATTDKLFLLAEYEINGVRTYANSYEQNYQAQYTYYKNGNSKVRYKHNATSTTCSWWTRSNYTGTNGCFCFVDTNGNKNANYSYYSYGFASGFRIA